MKRLAIITTHPVQYYAPVFARLQQRKNIDVHVFYTWGENSVNKFDPGFEKPVEWDIPLLDGYPYSWMKNTARDPGSHHFRGIINPELISQVKNYRPDAILVYGWAYHAHLRLMRFFKNRVPVFFRGDSTWSDPAPALKKWMRKQLLRRVYRYVDHAFYAGTRNRAYFKVCGLRDRQMSFAPHAVDNARFAEDHAPAAAQIRMDLGIRSTDRVILFAGKFEPKKDPLTLLRAFQKTGQADVHLIMAGDGRLAADLRKQAGSARNIHILPFQNQRGMPALYQACDVFCLPSAGPAETWGLAVNEAMAAGRPVIVSDRVGCADDLVRNGENGFVCEAGNADAFAAAIRAVLTDRDSGEMGRRSAGLIREYTFEKQVEALENGLWR